jgi:hypothetical protein
MLKTIGLVVVLGTGFVLTTLAVALAATPCVIALQRLYSHPPKDAVTAKDEYTTPIPKGATIGDTLLDGTPRWQQAKDSNGNASVQADGRPLLFDQCSIEDLKGNPVPNPKCPAGTVDAPHDQFEQYKVNETGSLVTVPKMTIEFPAGMSDDEIRAKVLADDAFRRSLKVDHYCPEHGQPFVGCISKSSEPWKH